MQMSVLIGLLKSHLETQRKEAQQPDAKSLTQRNTYLINLEAQLTFREMEKVIAQMEKCGPDAEITADLIKPLIDFFDKRWERIKSTNAMYCIEVNSSVNAMCLQVADFLSKQLPDVVSKKSHFALLMPTVQSWRSARVGNGDIDMKFPHSFLLTDDNLNCIEVGYLKEVFDDRSRKVSISIRVGKADKELSAAERDRLVKHSKVVGDYYGELTGLLRDPSRNEDKINRLKLDLRDALNKKDYARLGLGSSYERTGDELLEANLRKSVDELFISREQLFDYMSDRLTPDKWNEFISSISTETLNALIKKESSLQKTAQVDSLYTNDERHNKAVLFCLVETYWRERQRQGNFTHYATYVHRQGYTKAAKEGAVNAIKDFLLTKKLSEWGEFVKSQSEFLAGAIKDGTVGYITGQIEKIEAKQHAVAETATGKRTLLGKLGL